MGCICLPITSGIKRPIEGITISQFLSYLISKRECWRILLCACLALFPAPSPYGLLLRIEWENGGVAAAQIRQGVGVSCKSLFTSCGRWNDYDASKERFRGRGRQHLSKPQKSHSHVLCKQDARQKQGQGTLWKTRAPWPCFCVYKGNKSACLPCDEWRTIKHLNNQKKKTIEKYGKEKNTIEIWN